MSPQEIARKAASRAQAATSDYEAGVRAVQVAPGAKAAAKKTDYVNGVSQAADKWANNVAAVSLSDWQQATAAKSSRFAQGVAAAEGKIANFFTQFGPALDAASAKVQAMPKNSYEARKNRAVAMMDELHKFSYRK